MGLDPVSEQFKTVYAHFGLAIYLAQSLEYQIVNSLVVIDLIPNLQKSNPSQEDWYTEYDSYSDAYLRKTFGQVLKALKSVTQVPEELEHNLDSSLSRRNFLAHDFFKKRAVELMSDSGRESMIAELEMAQILFRETDRILHNLVSPLNAKYGITPQQIEAATQELLKGNPQAS